MRIVAIIFIIIIFLFETSYGQCPMCRMSAETNLNDGGSMAKGLNTGIIYLLSIPYILISIIGFLWWKNVKNYNEQNEMEEIRALMIPLSDLN